MANLSDAYGTINVSKIGKEFVEFVKKAQGGDAYYLLVDPESLEKADIEDTGDLSLSFSTFGRWSYGNNLEGYLGGKWLENTDEQKSAYSDLVKALTEKGGKITVEYNDSDTAMDWMGNGIATLRVVDGEVKFVDNFDSEEITLAKFADAQGESEYWALEYIYGDEVAAKYDQYATKLEKEGKEVVSPETWYNTIYDDEE